MRRRFLACLLVPALTGLALAPVGCAKKSGTATPETPQVRISAVKQDDVLDYADFTGNTAAIKTQEVKARVTGYLKSVKFKEGDMVFDGGDDKTGTLLYEIDERTYKADADKATAEVERIKASLDRYASDLARARRMRVGDAISREDFDKVSAQRDEAAAQLVAAKANQESAKLYLGFTKVYSETTGLISKTEITEGNLVNKDTTLLTTIRSVDPIYVWFDVDERTALRINEKVRAKKFKTHREAEVPVYVETQIEKGYPHKGIIDFADNTLQQGTGSLRVRAVVPNKAKPAVLRPGLFVRVRLPMGEKQSAILINEVALVSDQDRKLVYTLNDKSEVVGQPVKLGPMHNGLRVIAEGLKAGDKVIVAGLQQVRPGMKVEATEIPMPEPSANITPVVIKK